MTVKKKKSAKKTKKTGTLSITQMRILKQFVAMGASKEQLREEKKKLNDIEYLMEWSDVCALSA